MPSYSRFFARVFVFSLLVALAVPARAQEKPAQPKDTPPQPTVPQIHEQVEVVATRTPEAPEKVPVSIEVIDGDELRARGVTDLRGALALATGVDIAPGGDGGPASAVPALWGLKEFDAFLLVVDDVPWGGAFNPALSTLDLHDVERIEILRGPAPVTYGATSFVGVIHVVHKTPATATQSFTGRIGSYESGGGSATFAIPHGAWQSRLTVDGERQGFQDERTSYRRGHALWRSSRTLSNGRLWFTGDATLLGQNPASPHPRVGTVLTSEVPLDANHNPAGAFFDDNRAMAAFGWEHGSGSHTWATMASVSRASQDILRGFLDTVSNDGLNARGLREKIDLTDVYADTHGTWAIRPDLQLVFGGDYLHGNGAASGADFDYHVPLDGSVAVSVTPPAVLDVKITDRRDFVGGYVSAEWTPMPRLRIDGGVRLNVTNEEREGDEGGGPAPAADAGAQTHVRPSGSLGASWSAWSDGTDYVRVYTNYRDTFKPAAVDFGIGESDGGGEGILKPETSRSYEGGVKLRGWQGRGTLEATAFLMNFDNLVIARTVNGLPALTNAGTQRFTGFETGASWYVPQLWMTVRGTYSFHDATFRDYVAEFDGVPVQLAGRRLEMSPHNLASFGVVYAPPRGFIASGDVQATGSEYLDKRNRSLQDGYATIGLGAGYRQGAWEIRVDGRNLTDRRPAVAESELGDAQYYRLPGRRVDVSFTVRFGG
ncbi:MAG: TonB-dependent receptor [Betaproteobacteria bacterium]